MSGVDGMRITGAHEGSAGPVLLAADPEGQVLLVSTNDGRDGVCRWDADTGALRWRSSNDLWGVNSLAAVRLPGGRWVVAAAGDHGVDRWDALTGDALPGRELQSDTVWAVAAAYLRGGQAMLIGAGHGGEVHRWDPASGTALGAPLAGHGISVKCVAAQELPDGVTMIASGGEDGRVHRWDAASGEALGVPLEGSGWTFSQVAMLPMTRGNTLIAACDTNGFLYRWDATSGEPIGSPVEMGAYAPMLSAIHLHGQPVLVTSGEDEIVRLRNAVTGRLIDDSLTGIAASSTVRADGSVLIATGTSGGDVALRRLD
ncbi:WD40 repeat domain-containing protein [Kitasatospora indigofera]|uniref:WD40 repeat domain-containing protein n=1 Tax=Kitasatospora indigofera TaxID=67307 RepID=UPI003633C9D4